MDISLGLGILYGFSELTVRHLFAFTCDYSNNHVSFFSFSCFYSFIRSDSFQNYVLIFMYQN